jgi:hydrogen peroxide-dependent heme synthase
MHNPDVPETLEGWSILHQMFRVRWPALRELSADERHTLAEEGVTHAFGPSQWDDGGTALVHLLGHKGDLMVVQFRKTFEDLACAELALSRSKLAEYLEPTTSYVSVVELGMYEMTAKIHRELEGRGLKPGSDEHDRAFDAEMKTQRERVMGRLFTDIPRRRYVCFYPMNKRRGEEKNWYRVPFAERAEMMREHGIIGRHYAGSVTQIISGSIGFDDWEWGVDLFADDPLVFKKLIYEMRFDRASAEFAEFGPFYVGLQFDASDLPALLDGRLPGLAASSPKS